MAEITVYTVQAFSDCPDGGNGAGVVLNASGLAEKDMLAIAKEMGFSETAFVLPSEKADFRVRFFTPVEEVDLCGHATIATFATMLEKGVVTPGQYHQETLAGVLGLSLSAPKTVFMTQTQPSFLDVLDKRQIAQTLNLSLDDFHESLPVQIVSTGLPDVLVPVKSLEVLHTMKPDFDAVQQISEQYDTVGYHVFTLETLDAGNTAHCRNLAPRFGIPEEAATGTASGALSCYLYQHGVIDSTQAAQLRFEQGHCMDSPSDIQACLTLQDGVVQKVQVGGTACVSGQRILSLDTLVY